MFLEKSREDKIKPTQYYINIVWNNNDEYKGMIMNNDNDDSDHGHHL